MHNRVSRLVLLAALCAATAFANACTAAASGNWSANGTWASCGGTHPGASDSVAIAAGATITCDLTICANTTLSVAATGGFIIATGSTWEPSGNASIGGPLNTNTVVLTFQAGSGLNCMPPASTNVVLTVGYNYESPSLWNIAGTSGSHVTLTTTPASGATCSFAQGQISGLSLNWQYADFSNFYNASNKMIPVLGLGGAGASDVFTLLHNTFANCGSVTMNGDTIQAAAIIDVENNNWSGSKDTSVLTTNSSGYPATGARKIINNVFDALLTLTYPAGYTYTGNVLLVGADYYDDTNFVLPSPWSGNFNMQTGSTGTGPHGISGSGTIQGNYFYVNSSVAPDAHSIQDLGNGTTVNVTGNILEAGNVNGLNLGGVLVTATNSTVVAAGNIILPDAGGFTSGRIYSSPAATSAARITATSNTYISIHDNASGVVIGESTPAFAGQLVSAKYNLAYGGGWVANDTSSSPTTDAMLSANADYNDGYLLATGTCKDGATPFSCYGYTSFVFTSGTPGVHDKTLNPQFVDSARNLKKWDLSLGGPGTEAHAIAQLALANTPTFNALYTPASLIAYVSAGFTPTNMSVYQSFNGHTPGSVAMTPQLWNDVR